MADHLQTVLSDQEHKACAQYCVALCIHGTLVTYPAHYSPVCISLVNPSLILVLCLFKDSHESTIFKAMRSCVGLLHGLQHADAQNHLNGDGTATAVPATGAQCIDAHSSGVLTYRQ